jgi:hypothetical protein
VLFALVAAFVSFQLPSHNIGCIYTTASAGVGPPNIRCDVRSGLTPRPRQTCTLDWTGLSMGLTGRAHPTCAGDTALMPKAPLLAYGRTWRRDGIVCRSQTTGLRCMNRSGHGFTLARGAWRTF